MSAQEPPEVPVAHQSVAGVSAALVALEERVDRLMAEAGEQAAQDRLSKRWRKR